MMARRSDALIQPLNQTSEKDTQDLIFFISVMTRVIQFILVLRPVTSSN